MEGDDNNNESFQEEATFELNDDLVLNDRQDLFKETVQVEVREFTNDGYYQPAVIRESAASARPNTNRTTPAKPAANPQTTKRAGRKLMTPDDIERLARAELTQMRVEDPPTIETSTSHKVSVAHLFEMAAAAPQPKSATNEKAGATDSGQPLSKPKEKHSKKASNREKNPPAAAKKERQPAPKPKPKDVSVSEEPEESLGSPTQRNHAHFAMPAYFQAPDPSNLPAPSFKPTPSPSKPLKPVKPRSQADQKPAPKPKPKQAASAAPKPRPQQVKAVAASPAQDPKGLEAASSQLMSILNVGQPVTSPPPPPLQMGDARPSEHRQPPTQQMPAPQPLPMGGIPQMAGPPPLQMAGTGQQVPPPQPLAMNTAPPQQMMYMPPMQNQLNPQQMHQMMQMHQFMHQQQMMQHQMQQQQQQMHQMHQMQSQQLPCPSNQPNPRTKAAVKDATAQLMGMLNMPGK
eukprot:TRINITY_DN6541_c0_g1_i11.p1 TRINITY_DN6541_c0_g1~~TRINITY_DN6541_c0_g1_i11.p1  ORF type:complete len:460 (-),score=98.17 TRINITY_DN6541_c0_g1_i11:262-1641(-)